MRNKIKVLVEEHMRPYCFYNDFLNQKPTNKMISRLARRLNEAGTNIYMLSLLAEADQRGRNGESETPIERERVDKLDEWQKWITETAKNIGVLEKMPEKFINGEQIMEVLSIKPGPLVGLIDNWIYIDQLEGLINSFDGAKIKAREFYDSFNYRKLFLKNFVEQRLGRQLSDNEIYKYLKQEQIKDELGY